MIKSLICMYLQCGLSDKQLNLYVSKIFGDSQALKKKKVCQTLNKNYLKNSVPRVKFCSL